MVIKTLYSLYAQCSRTKRWHVQMCDKDHPILVFHTCSIHTLFNILCLIMILILKNKGENTTSEIKFNITVSHRTKSDQDVHDQARTAVVRLTNVRLDKSGELDIYHSYLTLVLTQHKNNQFCKYRHRKDIRDTW